MTEKKRRGRDHRLPESLTPEQVEVAIQTRREYNRAYARERYRKDPERQREANLRYWARRGMAQKQEGGGSDG